MNQGLNGGGGDPAEEPQDLRKPIDPNEMDARAQDEAGLVGTENEGPAVIKGIIKLGEEAKYSQGMTETEKAKAQFNL